MCSSAATTQGKETATLKGHSASVDQLCWHPSQASALATASADKSVRVWDARCTCWWLCFALRVAGKPANSVSTAHQQANVCPPLQLLERISTSSGAQMGNYLRSETRFAQRGRPCLRPTLTHVASRTSVCVWWMSAKGRCCARFASSVRSMRWRGIRLASIYCWQPDIRVPCWTTALLKLCGLRTTGWSSFARYGRARLLVWCVGGAHGLLVTDQGAHIDGILHRVRPIREVRGLSSKLLQQRLISSCGGQEICDWRSRWSSVCI